MTKNILSVNSSIFGEQGVSSQLVQALIDRLEQAYPGANVVKRDLAAQPLPHFSGEFVTALSADAADRSASQRQAVAQADQVIAEVSAAEVLILAAPMYNFGVPSTLKAWLDYLARAGVTFRYTDKGPEGLLGGKTAYVVTTRGGLHKDRASDVETPFLRTYLNFVGITDIHFIYAEGLNMGQKAQSLEQAQTVINQLVA